MRYILLLLLLSFLSVSQLFSQVCTPEWTLPGSGISPDTIENMPVGVVDVPYDIVVQFKVPKVDSSIVSTGINVHHVELTNVSGLELIPASSAFHYNCNPSTCSFVADSTGCVRIQGTPNAAGVYSLTINAKVFITPYAFIAVDFTGYKITINETIGMSFINQDKFDVSQNKPNPANSSTEIYVNLPVAAPIEFKVSDIIGNQVYKTTYKGRHGFNTLNFDCSKYAPGIYFYSVSDGKSSITKRMVVEKK